MQGCKEQCEQGTEVQGFRHAGKAEKSKDDYGELLRRSRLNALAFRGAMDSRTTHLHYTDACIEAICICIAGV